MTPVTEEHQLSDGRVVVLRPAGPADVPAITRLYHELSPESFHSRFQSGPMPSALVTRFAEVGPGTVSLVAADDCGLLAAEARYVPIGAALAGTGVAELAVTVRDSFQGAGLGRLLLEALVQRAGTAGLQRLRAMVLLSNRPMLRLLQRYGWVLAGPTEDFCIAFLEISATGGMPGWPAESAGQRVLVERRGWFDDEATAQLRLAGKEVRVCTGPLRRTGRVCPLVASGQCRLAQEADLIVNMLPGREPECAAVLAAHEQRWPQRLAR